MGLSAERLRILESIDWSFPDDLTLERWAQGAFDFRRHHWYPATFVPELPYTLIEVLSEPGQCVLDPFAGVATTAWQSLLLGRIPYALEVNKVAVEVAQSFWHLISSYSEGLKAIDEAFEWVQAFDADTDYTSFLSGTFKEEYLRPWFNVGSYNELCYLAQVIERTRTTRSKAALSLAVSSSLAGACEQRRGWGCIADNMLPVVGSLSGSSRYLLQQVTRRLTRLRRDVRAYGEGFVKSFEEAGKRVSKDPGRHIAQCNVMSGSIKLPDQVDLVVTSPPYPSMTDYSTSQRLSYYWLGARPEDDVRYEIGARRKRFRQDWGDLYIGEMRAAFSRIVPQLRSEGYLCLILPIFESRSSLEDVRTKCIELVLDDLAEAGLTLLWDTERFLPAKRRHNNQSWARLKRERVLVYGSEA